MPKGEICTYGACRRVLEDGKDLYVPRVGLDFEQCDMDLIKVDVNLMVTADVSKSKSNSNSLHADTVNGELPLFCHDWPKNKWGIPEAPLNVDYEIAQPGTLDLLIVPGLAFDRYGCRLGQGKGYYDRFISKMRMVSGSDSGDANGNLNGSGDSCKRPFLIAVGLEPSLVEDRIPTNDHDCKMDMIILPQIGVLDLSN